MILKNTRIGLIGAACLLACACASSSTRDRLSDDREGLGPDLRVFSDDLCLTSEHIVRSGPIDLAGTVIKGIASLAVKSFGRFLEEVGSPEIETATGIHAAMFFDARSDPPVLNPELRCLYLVRDGFQQKGFASSVPEDLVKTWQRLGLTGMPSLYAMLRLDPVDDGTGHFKASLVDFVPLRFARLGGEAGRDYVMFLEFVVPSGGRRYHVSDKGELAFDPAGPFARAGIALRGAQEGAFLRAPQLKGLESGWMTGPPEAEGSGRRPVNLYVDVVEMKRGNPFLADVGRFLQSAPVADGAGDAAAGVLDEAEREKAGLLEDITNEKAERKLQQTMEDSMLSLRALMRDDDAVDSAILTAVQAVEDAAADLEFQRRTNGWRTAWPSQAIADAAALSAQGRSRIAN